MKSCISKIIDAVISLWRTTCSTLVERWLAKFVTTIIIRHTSYTLTRATINDAIGRKGKILYLSVIQEDQYETHPRNSSDS